MGGTIIYVRRGLDQNSVPVPGLTHLEAIAIQVTLAAKPVLILAAKLSPTHPQIGAELNTCLCRELPVLMARYLNEKHVDFN